MRSKFSLRTLLSLVLLVGAITILLRNSDSWVVESTVAVSQQFRDSLDTEIEDKIRDSESTGSEGSYVDISLDGKTSIKLDVSGSDRSEEVDTADVGLSPDRTRALVARTNGLVQLWDLEHQTKILTLHPYRVIPFVGYGISAKFTKNGKFIITKGNDKKCLWIQRRPEEWWGLGWLPEFWIMIVLSAVFLWSIYSDGRTYKNKD